MSWTIIRTPECWAKYQQVTAETLKIKAEQVAWGDGPQQYPALACTLMPPRPPGAPIKLYSAYVYPSDAEELLKAAGVKLVDPDAPVVPSQPQFNRWVAAQMMTVAYFLVETGICKPEQFEDKLLEMITKVDEYQGEKKEELKAQLRKYEATVLDTLQPPG